MLRARPRPVDWALLSTVLLTGSLSAQETSVGVAVGVALPRGSAATFRDRGPTAGAFASVPLTNWSDLRLDIEWSQLDGPPAGDRQGANLGDLRILNGSLSGVLHRAGRPFPYVTAGVGAASLQALGQRENLYGVTPMIHLRGGWGGTWSGWGLFAEFGTVVHLTDYGSNDFEATTYWPVRVGVRR